MSNKFIKKGVAVSMAFALTLTSINDYGFAKSISVSAASQIQDEVTLLSQNFNSGIDGWSYGSGWEYNYSGKDNSSVEADNGMLKMNVDYSKDAEQSWSQAAVSYWNNDGNKFSRANKVTLDFLYDSAKLTKGFFTIMVFSNAGINANVPVNTANAETVSGTIKKASVSISFDALGNSASDNGFAICLIGNNTDYKGSVWFDNLVVSGEPVDLTADDVDSKVAVKSADEQQVIVSGGKLITATKDGSEEKTSLSTKAVLVDKKATENTKKIYAYLKAVGASQSVIYGHQDDTFQKAGSSELTNSDTKDVTGSISGIFGIDALTLCGNEYSASQYNASHGTTLPENVSGNIIAAANVSNEAIAEGAIVTMSAHMPNFSGITKNANYNYQTDPSYAKYDFSPTTFNDTSGDTINNILPGGKYNKVYTAYLDMIADYADMVNGTILFRPFHENTGSWFWWGAAFCDAETYKNVYRYTIEYLRDTKGVHNMLFEYSPSSTGSASLAECAERYPGDNYVDIMGVDMYDRVPSTDGKWMKEFKAQLQIVNQFAKNHGKLFTVTETGPANDTADGDNQTALLRSNNGNKDWYNQVLNIVSETDASYFLTWANFAKTNGFYSPYVDEINKDGSLHGHEMLDNFISFYNDGRSIFAANQKAVLAGDSISKVTASAVTEKAAGYIVTPISGSRILKAATISAKITNRKSNTAVKFVLKTKKKTVSLNARLMGSGYYKAALSKKQLASLGKQVGTLELYIDGKKAQSLSEIYNIAAPVEDETLVDGFENYNGVDSQLTKAWTANKDTNCNISFTLNKSKVFSGSYGLTFNYDETSTGWGGSTINKNADWSNCNALQFYMIPDGNNQKTVIQITAGGVVYETYLNAYSTYKKMGKTPILVTIPFSEFCQRDTKGNPKGGLEKDCKAVTSVGLWVNALKDTPAVKDGRVSGTLYYDAVTAVNTKTTKISFVKASTAACKNLKAQTIKMKTSSLSLKKGKTKQLTAAVSGKGDTSITWYSTNSTIASVSKTGKVTANRAGTATIVAKTRYGKQAVCKVTVTSVSNGKEIVAASSNYVTSAQLTKATNFKGANASALAAVMKKAAAGGKITIAAIGGSITQGTVSNGTLDSKVENKSPYAAIFFNWWKETFPNAQFEFVNAGIGATDSYLGVHRVQSDVLSKKPDLVLVEFAVNDAATDFYKQSYDNLVRKLLKSDVSPAVMLLFMSQTNDSSAQENQAEIGSTYGLPMISYKNVMDDMMNNGTYTKEALSGDGVHPSALGHTICGEIIWKYLNSIYKKSDSYSIPKAFNKDAVTSEIYMNAEIKDSSNITPDSLGTFSKSNVFSTFPNDWTCSYGSGELTFKLNCKNLGIMYYCQTDGNGGQFDVYIDGEKVTTLDADFTGGWGNYANTAECYTSDKVAEHTITIKKAENSKGNEFTVLGLLVSK